MVIGDTQLVLYRRHKRQSMRFYTFDFNELDILPSHDSNGALERPQKNPVDSHLAADPTRKGSPVTRAGTAFDGEALSQVSSV